MNANTIKRRTTASSRRYCFRIIARRHGGSEGFEKNWIQLCQNTASFCYLSLYASPKFTLTGRDIETRFVRKSGQEQDRRNDGKKEITF